MLAAALFGDGLTAFARLIAVGLFGLRLDAKDREVLRQVRFFEGHVQLVALRADYEVRVYQAVDADRAQRVSAVRQQSGDVSDCIKLFRTVKAIHNLSLLF